MSRHLHLDLVGGIAGDMLLGLLVDLGLPLDPLRALVERLELHGVTISAARVERAALSATHLVVAVDGVSEAANHTHHDHHEHHHGRRLSDLLALLSRAQLTPRAERWARDAVTRLFAAEATAHGKPIDQVHLHEAGADDAIVDIFGSALGLDQLAIESVSCSLPLPVGGGTVHAAHGVLPVPVPAVAELLRGVAIVGGPVPRETITPTGAALLRAIVSSFGPAPTMTIERTGHGAGTRNDPHLPNVVRGLLGQLDDGPRIRNVAVLETALDDILPQDVPVAIERLLEAGARDALVTAVMMKKGRPGLLLTVIADPEDVTRLAQVVLDQTPALGVRWRLEQRLEWDRDQVAIDTPWGAVRIKRGKDTQGRVRGARAEFEDLRALAERHGIRPDRIRTAAEAQHQHDTEGEE